MTHKILYPLAVSLLLALTLSSCNTLPESADINTPHEEITFTPGEEISSKEKTELPLEENTSPQAETTPKKTTDKPADTRDTTDTKTQPEEKPEVTPEVTGTASAADITSAAAAADSSEISPPVTAGENGDTTPDVQTAEEPVTQDTSYYSTEPSHTAIAATLEVTTTTAASQTAVSVTEPPATEPAEEDPPLTGGAYGQRYCTERESEFAERVFELTNIERAKEGLPAFEKMDTLKNIALTRAWELTVEYRADHSRPDGSTCTGAFNENGIIYGGWAENIAAGQDTPEGVVEAWMNSPSHRAAILNEDYTYMGVGYYYIKDDYQSYYHFWTQEFYHY